MKILKGLLVLLGLAGVVGAGIYTYLGWLDLRNLVAVAESMRSAAQPNPSRELMLGIGLALVGGLVLGLGLGLPRRSSGKIRKETLQAVATGRESEIRDRARGYSAGNETYVDERHVDDTRAADPRVTERRPPNFLDRLRGGDDHGRTR